MSHATELEDLGSDRPLLPVPTKPDLDTSSPSSSQLSLHKRSRKLTLLSLLGIWKYDLLLSFAAMTALICLLSTQDGKRQRTWADGTLTLNTAISILSTIIINGRRLWDYEVFHRASRGVPGSIQLLGTTGLGCVLQWWDRQTVLITGRHFASIGALAVVVSVAVGPFSQLLLSIEFTRISLDDPSLSISVARTSRYDADMSLTTYTFANGYVGRQPGFEMVSAITSGIMASKVDDLPTTCPTGDCDWPIVRSLAACGDCQAFTPKWGIYVNETDFRSCLNCSSTTIVLVKDDEKVVWNTTHRFYPFLATYQVIKVDTFETGPHNVYQKTLEGQECALWVCAKAYNISVRQGTQSESVVATLSIYMHAWAWMSLSNFDRNFILPVSAPHLGEGAGETEEYFSVSQDFVTGVRKHLSGILPGSFLSSWNSDRRNNITDSTSYVAAAISSHGAASSGAEYGEKYDKLSANTDGSNCY
jgi:hypothetical protein